jgi:putative peptidoglycan lipid II flippase
MTFAQIRSRFIGVIISATGVSLLVQVLAFLRQVLIAAYFGITREFDIYVMIYSLATFLVFTFANIFESVVVPHLVRRRETEGSEGARRLAAAILRLSYVLGAVASILLLAAAPLVAPIMATGFSPEDRARLVSLVWYFLPWTLTSLPYYAAAAAHKSAWRFTRVFVAEIVVVAVSIVVLVLWHDNIRTLPLAYAAGYCVGFVLLSIGAELWQHLLGRLPSVRSVVRNIAELYLANQIGNVSGVVDRHMQSFVPPGGIAAINYSSQLVMSLGGLLTFREIFLVPLSVEADRAQRLERLLSGMVLLAVPVAGFVVCFAADIVTVLFQRGRFDAAATALTAEVLRIAALGIITGVILTPLARMFQIVDRITFTQIMYGWIAVSTFIFGYLFVLVLGWGVRGVALMQLLSSATTCVLTAYLVSRCAIVLRWRSIFGNFLFACAVAGVAILIATMAASHIDGALMRLLVGGPSYAIVFLIAYGLARSHLATIMFGMEPTEGPSL